MSDDAKKDQDGIALVATSDGGPVVGPAPDQPSDLFAFTPERPETLNTPPPTDDDAPWDRQLSRSYNARLSFALMALVALAPVPLGSNRPVFWMVLATVVFAILGIYLGALAVHRIRLRNPLWRVPIIAGLAVLFLGYAVLQTVPLGGMLPFAPLSDGNGIISLSRDATRIATLRWASYAAFFFLMLQVVDNRTRARTLAWAIFLIITAHAAYGLISLRFLGEAFSWGPKDAYKTVVTGTFVNRNSFATFAGSGAILGFSLLMHEALRRRASARSRFWMVSVDGIRTATLWICLLVILAALVATGSRMGVAGTGAGLILVSVLLIRKHARNFRGSRLLLFTVGAIVLAGVFTVFGQLVLDRAIFSAADSGSRLDLYKQVLELVRARPLFGFGLDSFPLAYEQVHRPPVSPDLVWGRAHSTYLTLWSEMGLIFGSVPLLISALIAWRLARSAFSGKRDFVLAIAGLGVITLAAIHSLVDFSLEMPANVYLFLAILALGVSTGKKQHDIAANPRDPP
jgi:O-antigen ligase